MIRIVLLLAFAGIFQNVYAQGVAINETAATADPSAVMDINSVNKGLLIPRLTTSQRNQVSNPAVALLIYNTDVKAFQVNTGTAASPVWRNLVTLDQNASADSSWKLGGNTNIVDTAYLGTRSQQALSLKTNNLLRLYIDGASTKVGIGTNTPATTLDIAGTDAIKIPVGTTAQRPVQPAPGMIRFNSTTGKLEGYTTSGWVVLH